jgi:RNA recognition motif-containing protein
MDGSGWQAGKASGLDLEPCACAAAAAQRMENSKLHVSMIPPDMEEEELGELFGRYGEVRQVQVCVAQPPPFLRLHLSALLCTCRTSS